MIRSPRLRDVSFKPYTLSRESGKHRVGKRHWKVCQNSVRITSYVGARETVEKPGKKEEIPREA